MSDKLMQNNATVAIPFTQVELYHIYTSLKGQLAHMTDCDDCKKMLSVRLIENLMKRLGIAEGQLDA